MVRGSGSANENQEFSGEPQNLIGKNLAPFTAMLITMKRKMQPGGENVVLIAEE